MVEAVHKSARVKRITLKDVIHGLVPVSARLDGQERLVHVRAHSTSTERSAHKTVSVRMGHFVTQLMDHAYVLLATTDHCVMNIAPSSGMGKNVN